MKTIININDNSSKKYFRYKNITIIEFNNKN